jgi:electron transport complex protein RnfG
MPDAQQSITQAIKATLSLTLCAAIATLAVSWVASRNAERISANQLEWEMRVITEVLPEQGWDNDPWNDSINALDADLLGSEKTLPVYRARLHSDMTATVLTVIAPDAYVGPVKLLVGLRTDASIVAVRATEHRETPGLGDQIDAGKSEWILQFGKQASALTSENWKLQSDGGQFDAIAGATVTSRAVVNAVRNAQEFYRQNQAAIHAAAPGDTLSRAE